MAVSTQSGVSVSPNGGRSCKPTTAPPLQSLSFTEGAFWSVGARGTLYRSPDGVEWHDTGKFEGSPAAFPGTPRAFYVATHHASIFMSEDLGVTWREIYSKL